MKPSDALVAFYRVWHGSFHLPGAGLALRKFANWTDSLKNYPLAVPEVGTLRLDFRDSTAFGWLNATMGESQHEDGLTRFLEKHFTAKGVLWDVGANLGQVTASLLPRFPSATYCAFEPNPDLAERLTSFFSKRTNITVVDTALSDTSSSGLLHVPEGGSCMASISGATPDSNSTVPIKMITGDEYLTANPTLRPTLIKIDVEGHEPAVFKGCQGVIREHRPVIAFEHLFLSETELADLVPTGYQLSFIHDKDGGLSKTLDRRISHNAALLPI